MRGRTSRVPDPTADRLRLTAEARARSRAAPGRGGRAGAGRRAARRHDLTRGAGPAARPGGRACWPGRATRSPTTTPGLRLRAVPGPDTVVSQPRRHDHLRRPQPARSSAAMARAWTRTGRNRRRAGPVTAPRVSTAGLDAGERRIAARHLLASPILTASRQPAELDLVRRHASALKSMFASQLGYALIVESDVRPPGQGAAAGVRSGARGPPRRPTTARSRPAPTCSSRWPARRCSRRAWASRFSSPRWSTRSGPTPPSSRSRSPTASATGASWSPRSSCWPPGAW